MSTSTSGKADLFALGFLMTQRPASQQFLRKTRPRLADLWTQVGDSLDTLVVPHDRVLSDEENQAAPDPFGYGYLRVAPALVRLDKRFEDPTPYLFNDLISEQGLPGPCLVAASALAFDSVTEAAHLFDVDETTFKRRALSKRLSAADSERAVRLSRVMAEATRVFASAKAARDWLQEANHALGGRSPVSLLKTAHGEDVVLDELNAQEHMAPV